jgi:hypothetical protein
MPVSLLHLTAVADEMHGRVHAAQSARTWAALEIEWSQISSSTHSAHPG